MTRPTLMKNMDLVTKRVEKLISKDITDTFGVIFDSWTQHNPFFCGLSMLCQ